jgi:hypothetical protein
MRKLSNNHGDVNIVLMAVVAAIVIAISIPIVFSVLSGINLTDVDGNFGGVNETPASNATENLVGNLETFYSISPIYIVVLAAVGIISAVMMIMVTRRK